MTPTIPVLNGAALLHTIQSYVAALQQILRTRQTHSQAPAFLFPHVTTSAPERPLSENTANILNDLFPSVRALEEATRTNEGRTNLRNWLDARTAEEIIDFWEDEWIV